MTTVSANPSTSLTAGERRRLRAQAHHLQPVVTVGNAGLTPEVTREVEANLRSHELIKIRVLGEERGARAALIAAIAEATGAAPVQHIGKILVIYRPRPPEEGEQPTRRKTGVRRRRQPRRTKRSYQAG